MSSKKASFLSFRPKTHPRYYQLKTNTYSAMADVMQCQGDKLSAEKYLHVALDAAKNGNMDKDTIDNLNDALKRI